VRWWADRTGRGPLEVSVPAIRDELLEREERRRRMAGLPTEDEPPRARSEAWQAARANGRRRERHSMARFHR
jgi:hypothetical protein